MVVCLEIGATILAFTHMPRTLRRISRQGVTRKGPQRISGCSRASCSRVPAFDLWQDKKQGLPTTHRRCRSRTREV